MRPWGRRPDRVTLLATAAVVGLLVLLAVSQFYWIGEVTNAERERLRSRLTADAERFAEELDRELTRGFMAFVQHTSGGDPRPLLAEQMRRWQAAAPYPGLVRGVFLIAPPAADGAGLRSELLDPATGRFAATTPPADIAKLAERLVAGEPLPEVDGPSPALVIPLAPPFHPAGAPFEMPDPGFVLVRLDPAYLTRTVLPDLAERFFAVSREPDVLVAVAGRTGLVYRSDPALAPARYLPGDVAVPLLSLHRLERLHRLIPGPMKSPMAHQEKFEQPIAGPAPSGPGHEAGHGPRHGLRHDPKHERIRDRFHFSVPIRIQLGSPEAPGAWRLVLTHRAGSLDAAVARIRLHNLGMSASVLLLLTASLGVLAVSARRSRALAQRQIDLVAGITHELNTPLAAIRSAAQNLADGVVADPAQVRRYGALLDREGARLAGLVAQTLALAGIQSGGRTARPEPVAPAELAEEALADFGWLLAERGLDVERDLPPDLPPVLGDRAALRRALANLLDNAVKYAAEGGWIAVRGRAGDGTVALTVEDRGPGIAPEDRPHLFEPFYRGRGVAPGAVPGSGLGLALVRQIAESHGGTVEVAPGPEGRGCAFTLRLPAAPASALRAAAAPAGAEARGPA
jgi:signal transduction histidine kinase